MQHDSAVIMLSVRSQTRGKRLLDDWFHLHKVFRKRELVGSQRKQTSNCLKGKGTPGGDRMVVILIPVVVCVCVRKCDFPNGPLSTHI